MRESAIKGNCLGGQIPLGYKIENKKYVIDPLTAPLVKEAFSRYGDGETAASICADFNARGYRTASGAEFNKSSFKNIFRNEKYIGVYKYKEMRREGIIPRIIADDAWIAVQSRLKDNEAAPARGKAKVAYLLAGKIFCGHCGAPMTGECGRGKSGKCTIITPARPANIITAAKKASPEGLAGRCGSSGRFGRTDRRNYRICGRGSRPAVRGRHSEEYADSGHTQKISEIEIKSTT